MRESITPLGLPIDAKEGDETRGCSVMGVV